MREEKPTIAIIGGGFGGSLLALKLAQDVGLRPVLIESTRHAGPGLAYGAAGPGHLLNVPVSRMEVGLTPGFADWLKGFPAETAAAIEEAGDIERAFVPRVLFGRYLKARVEASVASGRVSRVRGEVTSLQKTGAAYELGVSDGRRITADRVVLATGNPAPKAPGLLTPEGLHLADAPHFVVDPWSPEALSDLATDAPVLLIGTGLTMADIALSLSWNGHRGPIHVLSRRGLLPLAHVDGGAWAAFLDASASQSPRQIMRRLRQEVRDAESQDVPWQRVLDAVRPQVARIWAGWTRAQRGQFLRHARPFWDVHRHRVAPRIGLALQGLFASGQLVPMAGRLKQFAVTEGGLSVVYSVRHRREIRSLQVARVINCTGPRSDYSTLGAPLFADLRRQGLIHADRLSLGIETNDARVVDALGQVSETLFAIGGLTRPAWWEVTAVPEMAVQISRLAETLKAGIKARGEGPRKDSLAFQFFDLGAGI